MATHLLLLLSLLWFVLPARADPPVVCSKCQPETIRFAFSVGRPAPYVIDEYQGIEVEVVREAFAAVGMAVQPVFMSYKRMDRFDRLPIDGRGVTKPGRIHAESVYYSEPYIYYRDVAISRREDRIELFQVSDLQFYRITAWQSAASDLDLVFADLYGENGSQRDRFYPLINDLSRAKLFWSGRVDIIVDDLLIFRYMTDQVRAQFPKQKYEYQVHQLWPERNWFYAAFRNQVHRDKFNEGLKIILENGIWHNIFKKYNKLSMELN